jgi:3-oxoacyl-[acyl-carrier-protein] synthase III
MGTIIKSTGVSTGGPMSSIEIAALAAEKAIKDARIKKSEIGLLINTGVFRDDNLMEPAIAPLIQKKLDLNNDPVKHGGIETSTLSFDIDDGECGFISAARVADAYLTSGTVRYALIVSADIHPSKKDHPGFPFKCAGAAVLLTHIGNSNIGFANYNFRTSPESYLGFSAFLDLSNYGKSGRERVECSAEKDYLEKLHEYTVETINESIKAGKIVPSDIDYIITSNHEAGFGEKIAKSLGMNGRTKTIDVFDKYGDTHSSALPIGFHHLMKEEDVQMKTQILFIGAGAGLTAACSLYIA